MFCSKQLRRTTTASLLTGALLLLCTPAMAQTTLNLGGGAGTSGGPSATPAAPRPTTSITVETPRGGITNTRSVLQRAKEAKRKAEESEQSGTLEIGVESATKVKSRVSLRRIFTRNTLHLAGKFRFKKTTYSVRCQSAASPRGKALACGVFPGRSTEQVKGSHIVGISNTTHPKTRRVTHIARMTTGIKGGPAHIDLLVPLETKRERRKRLKLRTKRDAELEMALVSPAHADL